MASRLYEKCWYVILSVAKDLACAMAFVPRFLAASAAVQILRLPTKNVGTSG